MSTITVLGRLGKDAEFLMSKNNEHIKFYTFSIAENQRQIDKTTGKVIEKSIWFNVSYFSNSEKIGEYLKKGCQVVVTGKFLVDKYLTDDKKVMQTLNITASNLDIIFSKRDEEQQPVNDKQGKANQVDDTGNDDLPF